MADESKPEGEVPIFGTVTAEDAVVTPALKASQATTIQSLNEWAEHLQALASRGSTNVVNSKAYAKGQVLTELFQDIPRSRLEDLMLRKRAGSLTALERLALFALQGGDMGEEVAPGLIDAAQEEWGGGQYRVPVKVIGNTEDPDASFLAVMTSADGQNLTVADADRLQDVLARLMGQKGVKGHVGAVILPAGAKLEVYEVIGNPKVEVQGASKEFKPGDRVIVDRGEPTLAYVASTEFIEDGALTVFFAEGPEEGANFHHLVPLANVRHAPITH